MKKTSTVGKCTTCSGSGKVKVPNPEGLREARQRAGLTLRQVAERVGHSVVYLCDVELGRRRCTEKILAAYEALER